jgi:predicted kinase
VAKSWQRVVLYRAGMSLVHLICGPVGAGKTTFSLALAEERRALRLSIDEWMLRLFGEHMARELLHQRIEACLDLMYGVAERLVALGTEVVIDCGYWRLEHREAARQRLASTPHRFCYLEVPPELRWQRLELRNAARLPSTYEITREMFEFFESCFEPPAPPELFELIRPPLP